MIIMEFNEDKNSKILIISLYLPKKYRKVISYK